MSPLSRIFLSDSSPPRCRIMPLCFFSAQLPVRLPSRRHSPRRPALYQRNLPRATLKPAATPAPYTLSLLTSISEIPQSEWDALANTPTATPFLRHHWLNSLETSGCASPSTGWHPRHIILRDATDIIALAPAYIKTHSLGEFVFDQEWADASRAAALPYYPKLLLAVPFTPATGRRILTHPHITPQLRARILRSVGKALVQICERLEVTSVHVNFCAEDEVDALLEVGFLQRKGVQFHFTNYKKGGEAIARLEARIKRGDTLFDGRETHHNEQYAYADFEDYLSEFKSKRRITMRRERTIVREQSGLEIQVLCGHEISEQLMVEMFDIYKSTIDKQFYGRQYLSRQFFKSLSECEDFKKCICVVVARAKDDGRLVGGTFNIVGRGDEQGNGGIFYGRYWGCVEEFKHLHFEACYYAAIEYCIDNGLSRMEPGAGGGDFKYMRGFEPSVTFSMHYLRDERLSHAIARYLDVETYHIEGAVSQMKMESAVRSKARLSASHLQQEE